MKAHPLALLALTLGCPGPAATGAGQDGAAAQGDRAPVTEPTVAPATTGKITVCPQSLGGSERVHRVISRDCGVVPVTEDYRVDAGSLTLEAGASLSFKDGAGLYVGTSDPATLVVQGTVQAPVIFTAAGDKVAGVWHGVSLAGGADGSRLEHLVIEYAGDEAGALYVDAEQVTLAGVKIRETRGPALVIGEAGGFAAFTGNEMKKIGSKNAIDAPPRAIGGLGGGNRFDPGAQIKVRAGTVDTSARWQSIGAALLVDGAVHIDGKDGQRAQLELAPGLELRFTGAGSIDVGSVAPGALLAKGSAQEPIVLTANDRRVPAGWRGVVVHPQGEATLEQVVFELAGKDELLGALAIRGGLLSLTSTTFRNDRVGVTVDAAARLPVFTDNTFVATPIAVALPAALVAALGEGNAFDRDSKIVTPGGAVSGKVTWLAQGVPIELAGNVDVDGGELTLEAGVALLVATGARLTIGASQAAALHVAGTSESPVTIGPTVPGAHWPGLMLASQARGNTLANLVLTSVSAAAAIEVAGEADVDLRGVTCSMCTGAVVGWACGAKVTSSQVLAADGTPAIDRKPEGC